MATAARQLAKGPVGVLPPASNFAELLRRSRFASFDPEVKQTYTAPPSYAQKGNWGLKRPISNRKKEGFITLKSYEDHAQYIEWNNAESQVRFVKRFEELNITPDMVSVHSHWTRNLGNVQQSSLWLTDSEFDRAKDVEFKYRADGEELKLDDEAAASEQVSLDELGTSGKGGYGASATPTEAVPLIAKRNTPWDFRLPNVEKMSAKEFDAYIKKLRELRPEFQKVLRKGLEERSKAGELKNTLLGADMTELELAIVNVANSDFRFFLHNHFEDQLAKRDTEPAAADPVSEQALPKDFVRPKIKPQPHRFAGLTYAHPSLLDTYYTTKPKPAFVLHSQQSSGRLASFAGAAVTIDAPRQDLQPLFTHNSGPSKDSIDESVIEVRLKNFKLDKVPTVVGKNAQGLRGVSVSASVVEDVPHSARVWDNTKPPGSFEYVAAPPTAVRSVRLGGHHPRPTNAFKNKGDLARSQAKLKLIVESSAAS